MGKDEPPPHELQLQIMVRYSRKASTSQNSNVSQLSNVGLLRESSSRWLQPAIYTLFLLLGQSVATLLGRLYYNKGGKSKWLGSLVQVCGFPILLPLFYILKPRNTAPHGRTTNPPSALVIASVYVILGLLVGANCMLFSVGLQYLPVSTFSLICATQLVFNAFFAFILNSQKFTPFIINSLVLLSISSTLLVLHTDDGSPSPTRNNKGKYIIGFLCSIGGAAGYALSMSGMQFCFQKVLRREDFLGMLHMMVFPSMVASCALSVGLFTSGEWKGLKTEMESFELGKLSYAMTLAWTAVCWQIFSIGATGLIFVVSSLFCNVISTLGLPIVPVFAAIFFHEKMNGPKIVSMFLAIWGFISYVYQHYLDDAKSKSESENLNQDSQAPQASNLGRG